MQRQYLSKYSFLTNLLSRQYETTGPVTFKLYFQFPSLYHSGLNGPRLVGIQLPPPWKPDPGLTFGHDDEVLCGAALAILLDL